MAVTITAVAEPANQPPRIRVTFADTVTTRPSATLLRILPDGTERPVRTQTGNTLFLSSGSGIVYDYEAPLGVAVRYRDAAGTATSGLVTVDHALPWLIDPGKPALSVTLDLRIRSFDVTENPVAAGVFEPLGRADSVVITDGARKADRSELIVRTGTLAQKAALDALLARARVLWLNVPPTLNLGVKSAHVHIGDVAVRRPSSIGGDPIRDFVLPYRVVSMPAGGIVSQRSYADVLLEHTSYASIAALPNYAALLTGPA